MNGHELRPYEGQHQMRCDVCGLSFSIFQSMVAPIGPCKGKGTQAQEPRTVKELESFCGCGDWVPGHSTWCQVRYTVAGGSK